MTQSLHPAAQHGFSSAAELYQQVRPNYPQALVAWLQQDLGLNQHSVAIDLGAGTGKFIPYLKQATPHIIAVEPIPAMLEQLKMVHPDVRTLQASSSKIPLNNQSVDAIVCAQSFHWFADMPTLKEIYRILKPHGPLGLIWNQRDTEVPWVKALADTIAPYENDTPRFHSAEWQKVFKHQHLFDFVSEKKFQLLHTGTVENVVSKRLLSTSFIAMMPAEQQLQLKLQFERIILEMTGKHPQDQIDFPYTTHAYLYSTA